MSNNQKTVTVKITRGELIDLLIACWAASDYSQEPRPNKWNRLHDKLDEQLKQYDTKHKEVD